MTILVKKTVWSFPYVFPFFGDSLHEKVKSRISNTNFPQNAPGINVNVGG
jgi:hypothetical protein